MTQAQTQAPDIGASNIPEPGLHNEPPVQGTPSDLEAHLLALTKQMAALTALVAHTVQNQPAGVKFVSPVETEPLPETPTAPVNEKRVWIILEDNDEIPPGGQFMQVDGRPYSLRSGEAAYVPVSLVDVLDHAIKSIPVCDENRNVIGYRDRLRFPYRVIREPDHVAAETDARARGVTVSME